MLAGLLAVALGVTGAVAPLAAPTASAESSFDGTVIRSANTFYAYVADGENLDVSFVQSSLRADGVASTVTINRPGAAAVSCVVPVGAPAGFACAWDDLTAPEAGIWSIAYTTAGDVQAGRAVTWDIDVQGAAGGIPGRVWSERLWILNGSAPGVDLSIYYQAATGDQYRATYLDFNGVDSSFAADAVGIRADGTCDAYYQSAQPLPFGGDLATAHSVSGGDCGPRYKLFFDEPAADLPASAMRYDGRTDWLLADIVDPSIRDLSFIPTSGTAQAGTISFAVDDFYGPMAVQIDANGNGVYGDPEDLEVPVSVVDGSVTVDFDGVDGLGAVIDVDQEIGIRAVIDRTGEIHFVNDDVEKRGGGISVVSTRGPDAGNTTLYWDDTLLNTQQALRCSALVGPVSALAGVDSTAGVHGWPYCSTGAESNANDGIHGSYGDRRLIQEWTYRTVDVNEEITAPARAGEIVVSKSADPVSGTALTPGQDVAYTLTFENIGDADGDVDFDDVIEGVLDDATVTSAPVASDGALTVSPIADGRFSVAGTLAAGQTVTVSYTVTVNPNGERGDSVLANFVVPGGEEPPAECVDGSTLCTVHPVPHFSVTKSATPIEGVQTGDVVDYTITVTNDGGADFTAENPAGVTDDLSDVLDDATFDGDATAVASDGTTVPAPTFDSPVLSWSGPLAVGASVDIVFPVTVTNRGDADLVNVATPVCSAGVVCDPETPPVTILLPRITPEKSSDPASGSDVVAGQVVTYTLTYTNDGQAAGRIDSTDDLARVLDDADVTAEPTTDAEGVTAVFDAEARTIRVEGPLAAGATATVTYQVTVRADGDRGDNILKNVLTPDVPPDTCDPADTACEPFTPPSTEHFAGELVDWKTVDPASGSTVRSGQIVTYTLHFENTGEAPVAVDREDVLTQVLDDATVTSDPVSSDAALTASAIEGERFAITGTLAPGQLVTVTYQVTVNADGARGDDRLANFLVDAGEEPPTECAPTDAERAHCTVTHVSDVVVTKSADPVSGTAVQEGEQVTYTLTFRNVSENASAADAGIDYTDHLVDVLDDATLSGSPVSSSDAVASTVSGDTIRVVGAVASGQTVTVTYTVTVKAWADQGDHRLDNVVAITGEDPICTPDNGLCTTHPIAEPDALATTGGEPAMGVAAAGLVLLFLGGLLLVARARGESVRRNS